MKHWVPIRELIAKPGRSSAVTTVSNVGADKWCVL